jgi:hypothetical protein
MNAHSMKPRRHEVHEAVFDCMTAFVGTRISELHAESGEEHNFRENRFVLFVPSW